MVLNERELDVVCGVLENLLNMPYEDVNNICGSENIACIADIWHKLYWRHYIEKRGLNYDEMTEDDWNDIYVDETINGYDGEA